MRQKFQGCNMTAISPAQVPLISDVHLGCGPEAHRRGGCQAFPAVEFGSKGKGSQAAHYTRHVAWAKGTGSKWKTSGVWTNDSKVWTPGQELKLTHSSRVGPRRRPRWAAPGEWKGRGGGPRSWLTASPLCNENGILNRIKLGRQNKAIPLNKCSALKQPE